MTFTPQLEPDESILCKEVFDLRSPSGEPFCVTLTNRALYMPSRRRVAIRNPWVLRSIPLHAITRLAIEPARRSTIRTVWVAVFCVATLIFMGLDLAGPRPSGVVFLLSLASGLAAVASAWPAPGQPASDLVAQTAALSHRWSPNITIGRTDGQAVLSALERIIRAAQKAGVHVAIHRPLHAPSSTS